MRIKYLHNQKFMVMVANNNFSCTIKYILRARDLATKLMHGVIVNGATTSLWFNPWLNHKSMVDVLGWHRLNLCSNANSNVKNA